jgi:hypothetical protein
VKCGCPTGTYGRLRGWLDERSASVNGDNQALLPQNVHGMSHGRVGDTVLVGQVALARELLRDLASRDPPRYIAGHLNVRVLIPERVYRLGWHKINIGVLSDLP